MRFERCKKIPSLKIMRHDPHSTLKETLVKTLTIGYQVAGEEASQIAAQVGAYLSVEDVGGAHFELLNVTLRWHALCGEVVQGEMVPADRFAGLPLIGVLRWFDGMRFYFQFNAKFEDYKPREDLHLDHVEAAACMALWTQEAEAQPYSPDDTLEALLARVNQILRETAFDAIGKQRLRDAMDRLLMIRCLTSREGWHRLKAEMKYQMPEE